MEFVPLDTAVCTPGCWGLYPWTQQFEYLDAEICTLRDYFLLTFLLISPHRYIHERRVVYKLNSNKSRLDVDTICKSLNSRKFVSTSITCF